MSSITQCKSTLISGKPPIYCLQYTMINGVLFLLSSMSSTTDLPETESMETDTDKESDVESLSTSYCPRFKDYSISRDADRVSILPRFMTIVLVIEV